MIRKLLRLLFARWILVMFGLAALALVIWFVGPLIAVAEYRPFESTTVRWILIGLLFGLYLVRILWRLAKAKLANRRLVDGLMRGTPAPERTTGPGAEEIEALNRRFGEAVSVLKKARLGGSDRKGHWMRRFTGQYVYELPWYIFIGAPGSGKTTALVNSGLRFPLADRFGETAIHGVGGTRNCDWWFTEEAVLLDTAGRYTTQESNEAVDSAAWNGFLQLLRKHRPRRPINGVFVTVSISDLLQEDAAHRKAHAEAIRNRVQELHEQLGIRFPLYVLVTKTDLLAGFLEFFENFGTEERGQVWGVSFPYVESGEADSPIGTFKTEFKALEDRVNERLIDRMQLERDPQRRAAIYVFPQQFSALRDVLGDFLDQVFSPSRFEAKPLVRGVYFTSGTQEGSPIDRILGSLGKVFGIERSSLPPSRGGGKSYFLTRLLRDVIFPESALGGTNLKWERRRVLVQWGGLAAMALVSILLIALWGVSYARNKSYVTAVERRIADAEKAVAGVTIGGDGDVVRLLPVLDSVRSIARTAAIRDGAPTSMTWGLYQGDKLDAAARNAYDRLLQDAFLPRLALRIEERLREGASGNTELLYESLKAYLMLQQRDHFDADALKTYVTIDWDANLPREVTTEMRQALEAHLDRLLSLETLVSPMPNDENLIASARVMLRGMRLEDRIYARLKRLEIGSEYPEFTIAKAAGDAAALVFHHASGRPITKGVPGLFSYKGYYEAFTVESTRVASQLLLEQRWVLGLPEGANGTVEDTKAAPRVIREVRRLFLADYANVWEEYVKDIRLLSGANIDDVIRQSSVLSDNTSSPLKTLLTAIVREVTLVKKADADKSLLEKGEDAFSKGRRDVEQLLNKSAKKEIIKADPEQLELIVDNRFNNLRQYIQAPAPGIPARIESTLQLIEKLHSELVRDKLLIERGESTPAGTASAELQADADSQPEPSRGMAKSLAEASDRARGRLTVNELNNKLARDIGEFCTRALSGRYPINRTSGVDATPEDFAEMFGRNGKMNRFFEDNLKTIVDAATRPWSFKPAGGTRFSSAALAQFERAAVIRDVYFKDGGNMPTLRLEFKPVDMDASIQQFTLDVDGQLLRYSHGPQIPARIQWPGTRGTSQVRVQALPAGPDGAGGKVFEGPWALFRMFDTTKITPTGQPEKFFATFTVGSRRAEFEVLTSSVRNPFVLPELQQFQCPSKF